jgi:DNA ligase 1
MNKVEIKPMKAPSESVVNLADLRYPAFLSPKIDGMRTMGKSRRLLSSSMSEFPNDHLNQLMDSFGLHGIDGELVVGEPFGQDVLRRTMSGITAQQGEPDFTLYAFDVWESPSGFRDRQMALRTLVHDLPIRIRSRVRIVPQVLVELPGEAAQLEDTWLEMGFEGAMYRSIDGRYKFGRCTWKEANVLKVKRFVDAEAVLVGIEEAMANKNGLAPSGRRSTHRDGLVGKGELGMLKAMDLKTGAAIRVGPGRLTKTERVAIFRNPDAFMKKVFTYKHFPHGRFEAARHPVFKCWRHPIDLSA